MSASSWVSACAPIEPIPQRTAPYAASKDGGEAAAALRVARRAALEFFSSLRSPRPTWRR